MRLLFRPLVKEDALVILKWHYLPPYDCYNFNANTSQEDLRYLLDRKNAFFALLNLQGQLEGYCSFGSDGQVLGGCYTTQALDIGMGIRPDLVGRGRGKFYAQAVARYGINLYSVEQLRVTVAQFNKRAQRVWQQLGFEQVEKFVKVGTKEEFVIMICVVSSLPIKF
jgi:L-amino acid N-acyltransferase YncA